MLQETDEKASARGCDGGQIHRPPGQKLNGDPGAVETDHQGEGGRHRGAGHASPGYQAEGGGSDGHLHRGPGAVDPLLCGSGGAGEYPPEAGGGHRGGQSQGGAVRPREKARPRRVRGPVGEVPAAGDHSPGGCRAAGSGPQHISQVGEDGGERTAERLKIFFLVSRYRKRITKCAQASEDG